MPRRKKPDEKPKRPLRDMVICALCGAYATPVHTPAGTMCAMCATGRNLTPIEDTRAEEPGSGESFT